MNLGYLQSRFIPLTSFIRITHQMLDHSNTDNTIYDIRDPLYWDKESLYQEMDRVYDICIGCRLCFNLCPSFPSLFDSVDNAGTRKRKIAEEAGRVGKEEEKDTYLDLPEGEHASEASIEVEFRGEVTDLNEAVSYTHLRAHET